MGAVIGIEAAVGIAEAVEAGTTAAEVGAEVGTEAAEGAITAGTDVGTEAGTDAAGEASGAAEEGGDALDAIVEKLGQAVQKVLKMAKEYVEIDAIFKAAKQILAAINPGSQEAQKLAKLINILNESATIMTTLANWLSANANKETNLGEYTVSLQGVVSQFLPKLGAAAGVLKSLSNTVATKYNKTNTPITADVVASFETGITTVVESFTAIAAFKEKYVSKVALLAGMPITTAQIVALKEKLP